MSIGLYQTDFAVTNWENGDSRDEIARDLLGRDNQIVLRVRFTVATQIVHVNRESTVLAREPPFGSNRVMFQFSIHLRLDSQAQFILRC